MAVAVLPQLPADVQGRIPPAGSQKCFLEAAARTRCPSPALVDDRNLERFTHRPRQSVRVGRRSTATPAPQPCRQCSCCSAVSTVGSVACGDDPNDTPGRNQPPATTSEV